MSLDPFGNDRHSRRCVWRRVHPESTVARRIAHSVRAVCTFQGQVTAIDTRIDPVTRSIVLRGTLPNPDGAIRPGMFLKVEAVIASRENATLISEEALVPQGTKQYVFVVANNKAERREVTLGARTVGKAEILKGITPGETVVIRGTQVIRDGSPVTVRGSNAGNGGPAKQSPAS